MSLRNRLEGEGLGMGGFLVRVAQGRGAGLGDVTVEAASAREAAMIVSRRFPASDRAALLFLVVPVGQAGATVGIEYDAFGSRVDRR
ncbi:protein of unknown function [Candidatus Hydrogenisulfobacillus filiaventi]|uniref:Uncharacterized protein n=1 Tax=Candidatus Hydrogenisulfobacillus filiaventi TaxID=2707344 RepID=A0A6F8ZIP9_9FIRM|nr:protein of unknown function [Candidatus Hydrogenisulfobacillus filiaventi]